MYSIGFDWLLIIYYYFYIRIYLEINIFGSKYSNIFKFRIICYKLYFKLYASNARGTVVLRKDSCPATDFTTEKIIPENLKKISFTFYDQKYIIIALYGPRKDYVEFFEKVFSDNFTADSDLVMYVGD